MRRNNVDKNTHALCSKSNEMHHNPRIKANLLYPSNYQIILGTKSFTSSSETAAANKTMSLRTLYADFKSLGFFIEHHKFNADCNPYPPTSLRDYNFGSQTASELKLELKSIDGRRCSAL
jgi:hypothetical protein